MDKVNVKAVHDRAHVAVADAEAGGAPSAEPQARRPILQLPPLMELAQERLPAKAPVMAAGDAAIAHAVAGEAGRRRVELRRWS